MSCGNKPLVKKWSRIKILRTIRHSQYEKNLASVKVHWQNVIQELEAHYTDDKFWDANGAVVHELVGDTVFKRLENIFNLSPQTANYVPMSESASIVPSEQYYLEGDHQQYESQYSASVDDMSVIEEEESENAAEEQLSNTNTKTNTSDEEKETSQTATAHIAFSKHKKSLTKLITKSYSKFKNLRVISSRFVHSHSKSLAMVDGSDDSDASAQTGDDVMVHARSKKTRQAFYKNQNPYFEMLYCNESETDMIKWNSNYKQKIFEVSASDEYSKRAELVTKQISHDFYDWWSKVGSPAYVSEIKRPEDIEVLFQVWFDEHASRGIVLDPKILPCVVQRIADAVGAPQTSCENVLKRQIAFDIDAETKPAHSKAFGTCLPMKMKHNPPRNNTAEMWHGVRIPNDLRTMTTVFEEIQHLTSVKSFLAWLEKSPHLIPQCLRTTGPSGIKQPFVVPSDFLMGQDMDAEETDLKIAVSKFNIQIKDVLSKLLRDD